MGETVSRDPDKICVKLVTGQDADVLAAIRSIYFSEFPPSEMKPASYLAEIASRSDSGLFAALIGEKVIGFALLRGLELADAQLIEYMAILKEHQSAGYGRMMLNKLINSAHVPTVVEVERPVVLNENSMEARRVRFYLRAGFRIVSGFDYRMPQVGEEPPPPMELLVHGYPASHLTGRQLQCLVDSIYREVYDLPANSDLHVDLNSAFELLYK